MKTVVYCESAHSHALALIAHAATFSAQVIALCESDTFGENALRAGANALAVMGCVEDDCAQGDRIAQALSHLQADAVLFPATVRGRFLSAWTAARLDTGLTADCTALQITENSLLLQRRPAFGGNLVADILCPQKKPQMASVRPGIFPMPDLSAAPAQSVPAQTIPLGPLSAPISYLLRQGFTPSMQKLSLSEAKIIVAGGKGVGSRKGFEKLFHLASLLGGAVGATRSAVDAGFVPYAHQIGQTGVSVCPDHYIAFGISGMIQHTVGMNSAKTVIAVNRDRTAPIFRHADYGIHGDWEETADALIAALSSRS